MLGIESAQALVIAYHRGKPTPEEAAREIAAVQAVTSAQGETHLLIVIDEIDGLPSREAIKTYRDAASRGNSEIGSLCLVIRREGMLGKALRSAASAILALMPGQRAKVFSALEGALEWAAAESGVAIDEVRAATERADQSSADQSSTDQRRSK